MKTILFALIILSLFGASEVASATSQNNCSKIREQLSEIESSFSTSQSNNFRSVKLDQPGNLPDLYMLAGDITVYNELKLKDPVKIIFKFANANLSCFTNSQKLQIAKMKNQTLKNYILIEKKPLYSVMGSCNRLTGNDFEMQCYRNDVYAYLNFKNYKSILDY